MASDIEFIRKFLRGLRCEVSVTALIIRSTMRKFNEAVYDLIVQEASMDIGDTHHMHISHEIKTKNEKLYQCCKHKKEDHAEAHISREGDTENGQWSYCGRHGTLKLCFGRIRGERSIENTSLKIEETEKQQ